MPVQQTGLRRGLPFFRMLPKRLQFVVTLAILLMVFVVFFVRSSSISVIPAGAIPDHIPDHIPNLRLPHMSIPNLHNPLRSTGHKPPVQANSTSGEAKWYSDWKWMNPFSSSITLDESRSVLPPPRQRPPVYTYYEPADAKNTALKKAEAKLLLTWRRAWWANGFRPIVLGIDEAMSNPLYEAMQRRRASPSLEADLVRWLAWNHMGGGILVHWLALPMGGYDDPLLSYFRRGRYPKLNSYEGLGSDVLSGDQAASTEGIKTILDGEQFDTAKSVAEGLPGNVLAVDANPGSIGSYNFKTVSSNYRLILKSEETFDAETYELLAQLVNSHLHSTFQNTFSSGISVLKPDLHMTAIVQPALRIAKRLVSCAESPIPSSCPPNRPSCKPCVPSNTLEVTTPRIFRNTSTLFTIGTVPHPYTLASLMAQKDKLDTAYIRRKAHRDPWITAATKELLGTGIGASARLVRFKSAVASEWGDAHSMWLIPERDDAIDLDWHFGFALPNSEPATATNGTSVSSKPGSEGIAVDPTIVRDGISDKQLRIEEILIDKAKQTVTGSYRQKHSVREIAEAWSLADTEAWRFTRAYSARSHMERVQWIQDEKRYAGGADTERRDSALGRWLDFGAR
ncbi:MAG: hypothetical protein M1825_001119 [Sarcosagium campestre]|nr:MAG: hypothetical protein M1825_001119 [Sarcosagium campestre]